MLSSLRTRQLQLLVGSTRAVASPARPSHHPPSPGCANQNMAGKVVRVQRQSRTSSPTSIFHYFAQPWFVGDPPRLSRSTCRDKHSWHRSNSPLQLPTTTFRSRQRDTRPNHTLPPSNHTLSSQTKIFGPTNTTCSGFLNVLEVVHQRYVRPSTLVPSLLTLHSSWTILAWTAPF